MLNVKSTSNVSNLGINCLIYGQSGVGKTTLAGTLEGRTLIVSAEGGLLSLRRKAVDFIELEGQGSEKIDHLKKIFKELISSEYDNLYFDSMTEIGQCFYDVASKEFPDEKHILKRFGHTKEVITKFIKLLRDSKKNIFLTCLEKTDKDETGKRFTVPDIIGSVATTSPAYMDFVFHMGIYEERRMLLTHSMNGIVAKDRSGRLDKLEAPDLGIIFNKGLIDV